MVTECRRCLLNDEIPGVVVGQDGTCSTCRRHDEQFGDWPARRAEAGARLEKLLDAARRARRRYDVVVPLSGGKDSTYVLWLARKRWDLRTLAVTYDNGFLTEHARANVQRAVDTMGADHLFVRLSWPLQQALYRKFFLDTGFLCPACMSGIVFAISSAAAAHRVPLILSGTSQRTEEYVAPEFFVPASPDFYRAVTEGSPLETASPIRATLPFLRRLLTRLLSPAQLARHYYGVEINVPDYLDWNYAEIFSTIARETGWRAPHAEAEHSDCAVEPAVAWIRQQRYPALLPELTRFSKLVTIGAMTRDEARSRVEAAATAPEPTASISLLQRALGLSAEEMNRAIGDRGRAAPYLARHYGVRARLRALWRTVAGSTAGS
jgi:hypothetical protein